MSQKYYAFRVMPNGKLKRLTPLGQRTFGPRLLIWQKRRARRFGWKIVVKKVPKSAAQKKRDAAVRAMKWALSVEPSIHYSQRRPFRAGAIRKKQKPIYTDCSGFVTMIHNAAGWRDPNEQGYNGYGFTGTIRAKSPRRNLGNLLPGDIIVYGRGSGAHAVVVYSGGKSMNPTVCSHGQESGPRLYKHSVQVRVHGGTFTCHGPRLA